MRSVVLATYEGERYIGAQLDSIVSQLSREDEVIVSDDASLDDTVKLVTARNDPRIRVLVNRDRLGYVKNFGRAIASARGEDIFFADQDDVWLPDKVSAASSALLRKGCVASDAVVVDKDLRELHASYFALRRASSFTLPAVFLKPCFVGATLACRKSYLNTLLPFPSGVPHDFWITLNAVWDQNLEVIMAPLILYRRHPTSASVSATDLKRPLRTIFCERLAIAKHLLCRRATRWRKRRC